MRCKLEKEFSVQWSQESSTFEPMDRPRAVSVNSPPSFLSNLHCSQEDMVSSDSTRSRSEASYLYEYNSQSLLKKAESIKKSGIFCHDSMTMNSQDTDKSRNISAEISLNKVKSTALPGGSTRTHLLPRKGNKPNVMRYVRKTSDLFSPLEKVPVSFSLPENTTFFKGVHELEGQTYILKKIRIFLKNEEDIKNHSAYKEISLIKDNSLPVDIRYVNSWVELEKGTSYENSEKSQGIFVKLCIQMRYINNPVKLVKDLLLLSKAANKNYDEDMIYDMAEDICAQLKLAKNQNITNVCEKYCCKDTLNKMLVNPETAELQTWNICYYELFNLS